MAHSVAYKCLSSHHPSQYLRESGRSRIHLEQPPPQESSQPLLKRQKPNHPTGSQTPAAFWDNLSKIWLTRRALEELDRRNTRPTSPHKLVTRHAIAEWKAKEENWEPTQPAVDFLVCCSAECLEEIQLLARHGGPDLSVLRGVRIARCLLALR
jgi:hypothetical protein